MSITKPILALALLVAVTLAVLPVTRSADSKDDNPGLALVAWICLHSANPVAFCEVEYNQEEGQLDFAIYNGYPGYHCQVLLELENTGEDTVQITGIHIEVLDAPHEEVSVNLDGPPVPALLVSGEKVEVVFTVRINDSAAQNTQYSITGSIEARTIEEGQ